VLISYAFSADFQDDTLNEAIYCSLKEAQIVFEELRNQCSTSRYTVDQDTVRPRGHLSIGP